jgi:hypothetical protein
MENLEQCIYSLGDMYVKASEDIKPKIDNDECDVCDGYKVNCPYKITYVKDKLE